MNKRKKYLLTRLPIVFSILIVGTIVVVNSDYDKVTQAYLMTGIVAFSFLLTGVIAAMSVKESKNNLK